MFSARQLTLFYCFSLSFAPLTMAWQDDVNLVFRQAFSPFIEDEGLRLLPSAMSEARFGYYFFGSDDRKWHGGVEGDATLLSFGPGTLWHMGLGLETLADGQNDMGFRLRYTYYQAHSGLKWRWGPGVLSVDYRHRCGHGMDPDFNHRILIRSGPYLDYHAVLNAGIFSFDIIPSAHLYLVGQNANLKQQARGNFGLSARALWPLTQTFSVFFSAGTQMVLIGRGQKPLYFSLSPLSDLVIDPLMSFRLGLAAIRRVSGDISLHLSQIADSGLEQEKSPSTNLSLDFNFSW